MTNKSRYFLMGSAGILLLGLGGGMVAYFVTHRHSQVPAGLPAELRYVPADAQMVAYADVRSVMASEMRRELERMTTGRHRQQQLHEFAGIDLEKDVNHVIAYMRPPSAGSAETQPPSPPRIILLAQGTFDQPRIEQFIKDHGTAVDDYHGKHIMIRRMDGRTSRSPSPEMATTPVHEMAIGFVEPGLIAVGPADLVRLALDASGSAADITTDTDVMKLIRDESSANAWVVGRFDAVSQRMGLPSAVRSQVPPLRLVSASAHVDGGVKARLKAQTADAAAGDQLRDVVRGAIAFARLQAGSKPELQDALKTVEIGGTGADVQLSFAMTSDTLRALAPRRGPDAPPTTPPPQ
jgi:hypothetical protein